MKPMLLSKMATACHGRFEGEDCTVTQLQTDTRALQGDLSSTLFVALKGENFDGHDHLQAAKQAGVAAALVSQPVSIEGLSTIVVADTELALAHLATWVQANRSAKVVAITGSNGKTSVKTLTESVLRQAGKTYATPGNRNNEIGMPLAVIDAPEDAEFAIYEMGTGKPGDIQYLTRIAQPLVGLVNNVAPAHLERMGSLLNIADTKAAVYDDLRPQGVAVINADDAFAPYFADRAHGHRIVRFGLNATADVTATDVVLGADDSEFTLQTALGQARVRIAFPGEHNVRNACAAAAIAIGLDVGLEPIVAGLQAAVPVQGRLIALQTPQGATLIDDSYNANPGSMGAAIDTLASAALAHGHEAWFVMGDMRELGDNAEAMHREVGRRAKAAGIVRLLALGPLSAAAADTFGEGAQVFTTHEELADALRAVLNPNVRVLVKGSRGSAMDKVVRAIVPAASKGDTHAA